ncbi:MAG: SDR family oxidoreductase [Verrucomicrobiota bacterium]
MKILVTGVDGYIGAPLVPLLIEKGHEVVGVDTRFYRAEALIAPPHPALEVWTRDTRKLEAEDFEGFDAVVHLAELSNDPTGELAPTITDDINYRASVRLAEMARQSGVERFIYASSCSVYGLASDDFVDETSALNPLTAYAVCKTKVEHDVARLANDSFSPVFLGLGQVASQQSTFVGRDRRKLGNPAEDITSKPDVRLAHAPQMVIDLNAPAFVCDPSRIEVEPVDVGHAASAVEDLVGDERACPSADLGQDFESTLGRFDTLDLHAGVHGDPEVLGRFDERGDRLLLKVAQRSRGDLEQGDLGSRAGEHVGELERDDTGADEDGRLGQLGHRQQLAAVEQVLGPGQVERPRRRTGGQDDLVRGQLALGLVGAVDFDGMRIEEARLALDDGRAPLLKACLHHAAHAVDHFVLAADERRPVELGRADFDVVTVRAGDGV